MKLQSFFQTKKQQLIRQKKLLKRKALMLKIKIFFLGVLPVAIIVLAAKVLESLLRIKLREAASSVISASDSTEEDRPAPVIKPVSQTFSKPDFITPTPVSQPVSKD